jgi:vacuolar-type H+-ATPase subunit I/STV1
MSIPIGIDFGSYRKLQVLEKIINSFMRNRLLPVFAWMMPILEIIMLYIVIKICHSPDPSCIKTLMFAVLYFGTTMFTVGIFSAAAIVHNVTKKWIKRPTQGCKNKLQRKIRQSIIPLRLYFKNNYVDTLTPCVIQDFCVRTTASLLLLGKILEIVINRITTVLRLYIRSR